MEGGAGGEGEEEEEEVEEEEEEEEEEDGWVEVTPLGEGWEESVEEKPGEPPDIVEGRTREGSGDDAGGCGRRGGVFTGEGQARADVASQTRGRTGLEEVRVVW